MKAKSLFIPLLAGSIFLSFNPILISWILSLFTQSLELPFVFNFYNLKRILEFSFLLLSGFVLLSSRPSRLEVLHTFHSFSEETQIALALFFLLGLMSACLAIHPLSAFLGLSHAILWFMTGLLISKTIVSERTSRLIDHTFVLSIGIYTFSALLSYFTHYHTYAHAELSQEMMIRVSVYPEFLNPRFLAQVFILTWPILIHFSVIHWKKKPMLSFLTLLISGYWMALAIENESRAIFLSLGIALIGFAILFRKQRQLLALWFKRFATSVVFGLLFSQILFSFGLGLPNAFLSLLERSQTVGSYTDRFQLWTYAFQHFILRYPLLGAGPLNFAAFPSPVGVAHPHNMMLQIATEWGVPAALLFAFVLCRGIGKSFIFLNHSLEHESADLKHRLRQATLSLIAIGGLIDSLVSGNTVMPFSQLLIAVFLGWIIGVTHYALPQKPLPDFWKKKKIKRLFSAVILSCMLILISMAIFNLIQIAESSPNGVPEVCKNHPHCTLPPLMWLPEQISPLSEWFS